MQQRIGHRLAGVMFMILSLFGVSLVAATPAAASAPVLLSGSAWLGGSGVNVCTNSNGGGGDPYCGGEYHVGGDPGGPNRPTAWWQCVELAQRLYQKRGWHSGIFANVMGAKDIYDQAGNLGMSRQANGSIGSIVPGDMIIHAGDAPYTGGAGHVSVVDYIDGSTVRVVEQNTYNNQPRAAYSLSNGTLSRSGTGTIRGVVHDPGNSSSNSTPPPPPPVNGHVYYMNNAWDSQHDFTMSYGNDGTQTLVGDWNGNGVDTLAMRVGNTFYMNDDWDGQHNMVTTYGNPGADIYVGDWDGDGVDTLAMRVGNVFYVNNAWDMQHDFTVAFGNPGAEIVVGDWNGDGIDTFGMRSGNTFYMNNDFDGSHDFVTSYGDPGQKVVVGDWNGNGVDTLGIRVGNTFYMNDDWDGQHNMVTTYGNPENQILVGDWDGDGVPTLAMRNLVQP